MELDKKPVIIDERMKERISVMVENKMKPDAIAAQFGLTVEELTELFKKQRQDRLLRKAEKISESILDINLNDPKTIQQYGKEKIAVMKEMRAEAEFIRSTLGKEEGYSTRNEITGKNGEEIKIKEIIFSAPISARPPKEDKK